MSQTELFYIGSFQLHVVPDAFLVEVSFADTPPRQDKLNDLPQWTFSSKHAVWLFQDDLPILKRAEHADKIKQELISNLFQ